MSLLHFWVVRKNISLVDLIEGEYSDIIQTGCPENAFSFGVRCEHNFGPSVLHYTRFSLCALLIRDFSVNAGVTPLAFKKLMKVVTGGNQRPS